MMCRKWHSPSQIGYFLGQCGLDDILILACLLPINVLDVIGLFKWYTNGADSKHELCCAHALYRHHDLAGHTHRVCASSMLFTLPRQF